MNTERALQPGRLVLESELAGAHPGKPENCLCRGTGEIIFFDSQGKRVAKYCAVAVQGFQNEYASGWTSPPARKSHGAGSRV